MAKKQKSLTEKEKEQQRVLIPFDKAKRFFTNIYAIFEASEIFQEWDVDPKSLILKGNKLSLKFILKQSAVENVIESLDTGQQKIKDFLDPDNVPEEELNAEAN